MRFNQLSGDEITGYDVQLSPSHDLGMFASFYKDRHVASRQLVLPDMTLGDAHAMSEGDMSVLDKYLAPEPIERGSYAVILGRVVLVHGESGFTELATGSTLYELAPASIAPSELGEPAA